MSIHLMELIEACSAEAIASKLQVSEASEWRYLCRQYSEKFHTPLHLVMDMDPEFVILHVYESNYESINVSENMKDLMERIHSIEDPEYDAKQEKDLSNFIKLAEEEEEERLKLGKPVHRALSDEPSLNPVPEKSQIEKKKLPTEGYVNLSYLENEDKEE